MRGMNGENVPKKDTKKRETERSGENQKVLEEEETKKKKKPGKEWLEQENTKEKRNKIKMVRG